jgi:hypothetical protein
MFQKVDEAAIELLWILNEGKMAYSRLEQQFRVWDLLRNEFGVLAVDRFVMVAVGD